MRRLARFGMVGLTVVMLALVGAQILNVSPALAATIDKIYVTCRFVGVLGKTEVNAPYVRVQVVAGQPAQPQATRRAQATPPAKALLLELDPPTRWALPQVGGSEPGARPGNRRRLQTHPTRRRPRR